MTKQRAATTIEGPFSNDLNSHKAEAERRLSTALGGAEIDAELASFVGSMKADKLQTTWHAERDEQVTTEDDAEKASED